MCWWTHSNSKHSISVKLWTTSYREKSLNSKYHRRVWSSKPSIHKTTMPGYFQRTTIPKHMYSFQNSAHWGYQIKNDKPSHGTEPIQRLHSLFYVSFSKIVSHKYLDVISWSRGTFNHKHLKLVTPFNQGRKKKEKKTANVCVLTGI